MDEKINLQNLVELLAEKHSMTKKEADAFVKEFFLLIEQALKIDRCVKIKGLGAFKLVDVDSRESVKVNTGERFEIQGHTKISFIPDSALRDIINKPFAHFETVVLNENVVLEDTLIEEFEDDSKEQDDSGELVEPSENQSLEPTHTDEESMNNEPSAEIVADIPVSEMLEEVKPHQELLPEMIQAEGDTPKLSVEDIIIAELNKVDKEFRGAAREVTEAMISDNQQSPQKPLSRKQANSKSAVPYLITIILVVLLSCGSALFFIYYPDLFSSDGENGIALNADSQNVMEQSILLDTLAVTKDTADTVAKVAVKPKEVVSTATLKRPEPAIVTTEVATQKSVKQLDSVAYRITGTKATYIIKEGETLTRVSLRFYGTKALWPYIVQHNRNVIKNPDNVPYGTKLKIPELVNK